MTLPISAMRARRAPSACRGLRLALPLCGVWLTSGCAITGNEARLRELSIAQLHADVQAQRYTPRTLLTYYRARIQLVDRNGPALHAVLETNPDAAAQARTATGNPAQPLAGVPILLKDNIDTADRMHTTAGSLALLDSTPAQDAFIVTRLRAAGAVLLGKTNMSEWANFRSRHASSGWSARGGQTRNPYVLDRSPCGSSSGSGVAVAADLALVAVGTETDGSITCPAAVNGIVGLKPTVGLVSRSGIIPISASQDTAGPMARTVADAAAVLNVLAGYDPADPATLPLKDRPAVDYTAGLKRDALKGVRIGVLRSYAGFHEGVDAAFEAALQVLRAQGAILIDPVSIPSDDKYPGDETRILQFEFKDGINRYLAQRPGAPQDLAALIEFNRRMASREMPWFQQETFEKSQQRGSLQDPEYLAARERAQRLAGREGIDAALASAQVEVLVAPTMSLAWPIDLLNGDHVIGGDVSTHAAVAGCPHLTVPMGLVKGLPVGLSFVGTAWSDARLLAFGYAYEQAAQARRSPTYLRTARLSP
ncbi:MAG: amidase [Steroidobacteraceae bacterium]